jgi:hypothetical protein
MWIEDNPPEWVAFLKSGGAVGGQLSPCEKSPIFMNWGLGIIGGLFFSIIVPHCVNARNTVK